jgi:hypothetical protein
VVVGSSPTVGVFAGARPTRRRDGAKPRGPSDESPGLVAAGRPVRRGCFLWCPLFVANVCPNTLFGGSPWVLRWCSLFVANVCPDTLFGGSPTAQEVAVKLLVNCLYSSVAERQSCKLKVLGSILSGGFKTHGVKINILGFPPPPADIGVRRPRLTQMSMTLVSLGLVWGVCVSLFGASWGDSGQDGPR